MSAPVALPASPVRPPQLRAPGAASASGLPSRGPQPQGGPPLPQGPSLPEALMRPGTGVLQPAGAWPLWQPCRLSMLVMVSGNVPYKAVKPPVFYFCLSVQDVGPVLMTGSLLLSCPISSLRSTPCPRHDMARTVMRACSVPDTAGRCRPPYRPQLVVGCFSQVLNRHARALADHSARSRKATKMQSRQL